jgi:hypothetical protein
MSRDGEYVECERCGGWAHLGCEEVGWCVDCEELYCFDCEIFTLCMRCFATICPDCQKSDENGEFVCSTCKAENYELDYATAVETKMLEENGGW